MATGLSNTGFSAIQGVTPMWPPVAWPEQAFGLSAIYGGGAANIISLLGGALYLPDINTCWQDFKGTAGAYDKKVALIESEPARPHNYIINSMLEGAAAPATQATGWSITASGTSGVNNEVIGVGVGYVDIRFWTPTVASGTSGASLVRVSKTEIPANIGQVFSGSVSIGILGGAYPTASQLGLSINEYSSTYLANSTLIITTSGVHTLRRSMSNAAVQYVYLGIGISPSIGDSFDFTIRISQPQLELNRPRTFCPTYGTAIAPQATYFCGWQGTDVSKPYLRSADYSIVPFVSNTGETWTPTYTVIDAQGGFERSGSDAYWRNSAGTAGNYASTPDSAAASITGDLTLIVKAELADWTPATGMGFVSKEVGASGEYRLSLLTTGYLRYNKYIAGVASTSDSTVPIGLADGAVTYIKCVLTNGVNVKYYTSTDYNPSTQTGAWTQLGGTVANLGASATDTANAVLVGTISTSNNSFTGKIHYAAAWANTTGTGTPAWEFYPARDCTFPVSPWLQFDGSNDYLVTNIIPGNYSAGFVAAGAVQIEAASGTNALFGSSGSAAVHGIRLHISTTMQAQLSRLDGALAMSATATSAITQYAPFVIDSDYQVTDARIRLNGANEHEALGDSTYTGTTQYALMGAANNAESGVSATNYIQGNIHALVWLPVIPTEAQELAIRNYVASKAGVTL